MVLARVRIVSPRRVPAKSVAIRWSIAAESFLASAAANGSSACRTISRPDSKNARPRRSTMIAVVTISAARAAAPTARRRSRRSTPAPERPFDVPAAITPAERRAVASAGENSGSRFCTVTARALVSCGERGIITERIRIGGSAGWIRLDAAATRPPRTRRRCVAGPGLRAEDNRKIARSSARDLDLVDQFFNLLGCGRVVRHLGMGGLRVHPDMLHQLVLRFGGHGERTLR